MQKTGIIQEVKPTGKDFHGIPGYRVSLEDGTVLLVNLKQEELWMAGQSVTADITKRTGQFGDYCTVDTWSIQGHGTSSTPHQTLPALPHQSPKAPVQHNVDSKQESPGVPLSVDLWSMALRTASQMLMDPLNTGVNKDNFYDKVEEIKNWVTQKTQQ